MANSGTISPEPKYEWRIKPAGKGPIDLKIQQYIDREQVLVRSRDVQATDRSKNKRLEARLYLHMLWYDFEIIMGEMQKETIDHKESMSSLVNGLD